MKYRLIQNVDGTFIKTEFDQGLDSFLAAMEVRDFKFDGFNKNPRQRAELQDQPRFSSLCGPMWDGDAIRYEDTKSNDILST